MSDMIPCPWCKDGTMMGGTMTCLICDGARFVERVPTPPGPETKRLMDAIEVHCREWRDYHEETA